MRISTKATFETATNQLGTLQSQLAKTQLQLSTNRRMLTAADDPIASARALEVTQSQSMNTQFSTNRQNARGSVSQLDLALSRSIELVQNVQTLMISAGNPALSQADRASLATEISGRMEDLLGVANSTDGAGSYMFAGYKSTSIPFTQTAAGAQYHGDQGQRQLQVGSSRQIPISDSGSAVFENNLTGNGTFTTSAAAANTGSGIIAPGTVTNVALLTGDAYSIAFNVGATTTYTITNTNTGVVSPAQPYQSGQQISFNGMAFDIRGAPANGDTFTVAPSQKQSVFTTITNLVATLLGPGAGPAGQAILTNGINTANQNLSNAMDNVLSVRAAVGSRMKELDSLDSAGDDLNIQYASTLSDLQDLDLVKTISLYTQQQQALEAAQKSFKTMSGLSLFNYIG